MNPWPTIWTQFEEVVTTTWPQIIPPVGGGTFRTTQVQRLAFEKVVTDHAVIQIPKTRQDKSRGGLQNRCYVPIITLYLVTHMRDGKDGSDTSAYLEEELQKMSDFLVSWCAPIGQINDVDMPDVSEENELNAAFLEKKVTARLAGSISCEFQFSIVPD